MTIKLNIEYPSGRQLRRLLHQIAIPLFWIYITSLTVLIIYIRDYNLVLTGALVTLLVSSFIDFFSRRKLASTTKHMPESYF